MGGGKTELKSFHETVATSTFVNISLPTNNATIVMLYSDWGKLNSDGVSVVNMANRTVIAEETNSMNVQYIDESTIAVKLKHGTGVTIHYL